MNKEESLEFENKLLKNAFKILTKQFNALHLYIELNDNIITLEQYEEEIENNPEKYVIENEFIELDSSELNTLSSLVKELVDEKIIGEKVSTDEISCLFGVKL